jgi:putative phosphoesterase
MDTMETKNALPELNSLKILDKKIGVIHNPNILYGMDQMREIAKTNGFDVLVYGHTHNANIKWEDNILYINPGSPTSPSSLLNKPSVATIKITQNTITPEIIYL